MLGATEVRGLSRILHQPVKVLALASQSAAKVLERRVDVTVDLEAIVVAEVGGRGPDEVRLAGRSVGVAITIPFLDQPKAHAGGQEFSEAAGLDGGLLRQFIERPRPIRQPAEEIQIERGEQGL